MKSLHHEMPFDDYKDFPMRLGWKNEYYGGKIHVTPSPMAIVGYRLRLSQRCHHCSWTVRLICPDAMPALMSLFEASFVDTVYYVDYSPRQLHEAASTNIMEFLRHPDRTWANASFVVRDGEQTVGAALIRRCARGPVLSPLFVHPKYRRRGVASAAVNCSVNVLRDAGETYLFSTSHLGNSESLAWHQEFGFEELPDLTTAAHRSRYFEHERDRMARKGDPGAERLAADATHWSAVVHHLSLIEQIDFKSAHPTMDLYS